MAKDGGWILPAVIDPPRICIEVRVPNSLYHIAAFFGALLSLSYWFNWQRDTAHLGRQVGAVWFDVWTEVSNRYSRGDFVLDCGGTPEPTIAGLNGVEIEDCMTCCIRWVNGILSTKDCDGNWVAIPGTQGGAPAPGDGSPLPEPGGCSQYHFEFSSNTFRLMPAPVNSGDILTMTGLQGVSFDNNSNLWFCPTGSQFFLGRCNGLEYFDAAAFAPSIPVGVVLIGLSNDPTNAQPIGIDPENWFNITDGAPFTVPGGFTDAQVVIAVNAASIDSEGGSVQADIEVCNNAAQLFSHTFDFSVSPGGWVPNQQYIDSVNWLYAAYGSGAWNDVQAPFGSGPDGWRGIAINRVFPHRVITEVIVTYAKTIGTFGISADDQIQTALSGSLTVQASVNSDPGPASPWDSGIFSSDSDQIAIRIQSGFDSGAETDPGGSVTINSITVRGEGSDPF